jgi:hypothetical protein
MSAPFRLTPQAIEDLDCDLVDHRGRRPDRRRTSRDGNCRRLPPAGETSPHGNQAAGHDYHEVPQLRDRLPSRVRPLAGGRHSAREARLGRGSGKAHRMNGSGSVCQKRLKTTRRLWRSGLCIYNFCRVHSTLRVTPAMESGISDHVWTIEELCGLLPETASATKRIDKALILKALGEKAG